MVTTSTEPTAKKQKLSASFKAGDYVVLHNAINAHDMNWLA